MPKRISKKPKEDEYTTVKVPNDLILIIDGLIGNRGFKSRGEVVKNALRDFLDKQDTHQFTLNHDDQGIKVWDNKLHRHAQIQFTPKGIYCVACDATKCEHIRFAISQPDVLEMVIEKRKEGWKIEVPEE